MTPFDWNPMQSYIYFWVVFFKRLTTSFICFIWHIHLEGGAFIRRLPLRWMNPDLCGVAPAGHLGQRPGWLLWRFVLCCEFLLINRQTCLLISYRHTTLDSSTGCECHRNHSQNHHLLHNRHYFKLILLFLKPVLRISDAKVRIKPFVNWYTYEETNHMFHKSRRAL